jgi:uncharacterized membrane protein HdeD (DUF308 family)
MYAWYNMLKGGNLMIQIMKKYAVISLILGVLLIFAGIFFVFIQPEIGDQIKNFAIGIMIFILVLLLIIPELSKKHTQLVTVLFIIEIVIALIVSIMFITNQGSSPSLWIGLILYTHGLIDLIGGYFGSGKQRLERFILAVLLVTVGVYIFSSGIISNQALLNVLLLMFLIPGIILIIFGALGVNDKSKKSKKSIS